MVSGYIIYNTQGYKKPHLTCAVLILGQGALMPMSIEQKMNTKSSTEAELVGVDDAVNFVEWVQLFVEQQIKSINDDSVLKKIGSDIVIQQDDTSTIQLENNGKQSSTKRTRHIYPKLLYVTSKIKDRSICVIYHPTKQMVPDYLTKPLQGCLFRTHQNYIIGHNSIQRIPLPSIKRHIWMLKRVGLHLN